MLGAGWMGKTHTHAYHSMNYMKNSPLWRAELTAIASSSPEKAAAAADRFGYVRALPDWKSLIADPEIDVFDNVAPDHMHVEPTIAAMRAGKHVVCEKPIAVNLEDVRRMADVARETGMHNLCCFSYRFVPAVRLA